MTAKTSNGTAPPTPPRVLFVSHSSALNGAERSLLSATMGLRERGWAEPMVLVPKRGPLVDCLRSEGILTLICPCHRWVGKRFLPLRALLSTSTILFGLGRCYSSAQKFQPDIVYSNSLSTGLGIAVAYALKLPHILHAREFLTDDFGLYYDIGKAHAMSLFSQVTAHLICNSEAVANSMSRDLPLIPHTVVHNGIDCAMMTKGHLLVTPKKYPIAPIRLLIVGTISPGKNQSEAIEATAILRRQGMNVQLYIAGTGKKPYVKQIQDFCERLDLVPAVHFLGFQDDLSMYYSIADALVVCSRAEAFGRVAIEAMCFGTPVIAASSGGLPEIIQHRITGLLYEPGNAKALSNCVSEIFSNRELHQNISHHAKQMVESRFSTETYVRGIRDVIQSVNRTPHNMG